MEFGDFVRKPRTRKSIETGLYFWRRVVLASLSSAGIFEFLRFRHLAAFDGTGKQGTGI